MYSKLREKTGKRFVQKYFGGKPIRMGQVGEREIGADGTVYECLGGGTWVQKTFGGLEAPDVTKMSPQTTELFSYGSEDGALGKTTVSATNTGISSYNPVTGETTATPYNAADFEQGVEGEEGGLAGQNILGAVKKGLNIVGKAGRIAGEIAISDKNFGTQSAAIDSAVNGVSSLLESTGNPYAIMASKAIQGANFLTKAGGQTVQGFDVDINSSGYGTLGHMESSSSRDFGAMIGLGGLFGQGKMQDKLAKRNAQAKMAMTAANIAEDQSFEQEARANSIQNTIMNNNIALAGGLDTSLLGG